MITLFQRNCVWTWSEPRPLLSVHSSSQMTTTPTQLYKHYTENKCLRKTQNLFFWSGIGCCIKMYSVFMCLLFYCQLNQQLVSNTMGFLQIPSDIILLFNRGLSSDLGGQLTKTNNMAFGSITSRQIDGEKMKTVTNFIFLGSKNHCEW